MLHLITCHGCIMPPCRSLVQYLLYIHIFSMKIHSIIYAVYFQYEDTFDDYLEMFIQYGYVILFSSAFPLAALCALLNNVIEIRSDAFKLCMHHQRPFGKRVKNIGIWQVG